MFLQILNKKNGFTEIEPIYGQVTERFIFESLSEWKTYRKKFYPIHFCTFSFSVLGF